MKITLSGPQGLTREFSLTNGSVLESFLNLISDEATYLRGEMPEDDADEGDKATFLLYEWWTEFSESACELAGFEREQLGGETPYNLEGQLEAGLNVACLYIDLHDYYSINDEDWDWKGDYCLVHAAVFNLRADAEAYASNHFCYEVRAWLCEGGDNWLDASPPSCVSADWVVLPPWTRLAKDPREGTSWPDFLRMKPDDPKETNV